MLLTFSIMVGKKYGSHSGNFNSVEVWRWSLNIYFLSSQVILMIGQVWDPPIWSKFFTLHIGEQKPGEEENGQTQVLSL